MPPSLRTNAPAEPHEWHRRLRGQAERLAGGIGDLPQRAAVYHHLFEHSAGNHVFPLIAAHGALWARGYFRLGATLGSALAFPAAPALRARKLGQLAAFADAFRDINRRVCIETYTAYHFTARWGRHPAATELIPHPLLEQLNRCHAARRGGQAFSTERKRALFQAFFLWEQEVIVGPAVAAAALSFEWLLMRRLALRPLIRFAYFPRSSILVFKDFTSTSERIEKGFRAFDLAAQAGWERVEGSMRHYRVLPSAFFADSKKHFASIRHATCSPEM